MPAWERRNVDRWGIEACLNGYLKTAAGAGIRRGFGKQKSPHKAGFL